MPRTVSELHASEPWQVIDRLVDDADQFIAPARKEAMVVKLIGRDSPGGLSDGQMYAMAADAVLLSSDLLLSLPSASGSTAFDRLAKSRARAAPAEVAACAALRAARFRLLVVEGGTSAGRVQMRDVLSDEALQVGGEALPPLPPDAMLFGRVAIPGPGMACLAGMTTPLDALGQSVALRHACAGRPGAAAGARWAEAVYAHVVRHGTLHVPGLNRPADCFDIEDDEVIPDGGPLFGTAMAWSVLGDDPPDDDLLLRSRQLADQPSIIDALAAAVLARSGQLDDMAAAFERLLAVQLETVLRRERGGAGAVTLDSVGAALDAAIAAGRTPHAAATLFASLRAKLVGGSRDASRSLYDRPSERQYSARAPSKMRR